MAGKYATYSKWINKEIKIASSEFPAAKPILAIAPWGAEQTSSVVKSAALDIARWNTDSVVSQIRRLAL
jgi:Thoeris protein ThsB, TIR-like domain